MKNRGKTMITAAAISGLLAGVAVNQGCTEKDSGSSGSIGASNSVAPGKMAPLAKAPTVHDCAGDNDCKGIGGCKTDDHACKFKNSCKGKGGCHLTDKDIKDWAKMQTGGASSTVSTNKGA